MSPKYYLIIFFLQISHITAAPIIITVGEAQDPNCDFIDLQSAINSDALSMDIRVTHTLVTDTGIFIEDQPVKNLKGGYNNCEEAAQGIQPLKTQYSLISNVDQPAITVLISESRRFGIGEAVDMEITGFEILDSDGGIDAHYNGLGSSFLLELSHLKIHNNSDRGMNLTGEGLNVTMNFTQIYDNVNLIGGSTQGGGIRCSGANITLLGHTAIYNNTADNGAGIYALGCEIEINAGDTFNDLVETGIFGNTANKTGGGLYVQNTVINGIGTYEHPLKIHNNSAPDKLNGSGGGMFLGSGAVVNLFNTQVDNNTAFIRGAGIYSFYTGQKLALPQVNLNRSKTGCSYAAICSSVSFNHVMSKSGRGGAIFIRNGGIAAINQTEISYNQANISSGFYISGNQSNINLEGNLIHHNNSYSNQEKANMLFDLGGGFNASTSAVLNFNTITDNAVDTIFNLDFNNNIPQNLEVYNSIISNPQSQIVSSNGGEGDHDANIDCSLIHDLTTDGIEGNGTQVGPPLFFGHLDYKLQESSLGIDPNCSTINAPLYFDILGVDRLVDQSADLGAYESTVADSIIFTDGFEK